MPTGRREVVRGSMPDPQIPGAFDPRTGARTLLVTVEGHRISRLLAYGITGLANDVVHCEDAVRQPESVWLTPEGHWLFVVGVANLSLPVQPRVLGTHPPVCFTAEVRPTGARLVSWAWVPRDPDSPLLAQPHVRTAHYVVRRLHP